MRIKDAIPFIDEIIRQNQITAKKLQNLRAKHAANLHTAHKNVQRLRNLTHFTSQYLKEVCCNILQFNVPMPKPVHCNCIDMFLCNNTQPPHLPFHPLQPRPLTILVLVPIIHPPPSLSMPIVLPPCLLLKIQEALRMPILLLDLLPVCIEQPRPF